VPQQHDAKNVNSRGVVRFRVCGHPSASQQEISAVFVGNLEISSDKLFSQFRVVVQLGHVKQPKLQLPRVFQ
jgi:hypothetical protein